MNKPVRESDEGEDSSVPPAGTGSSLQQIVHSGLVSLSLWKLPDGSGWDVPARLCLLTKLLTGNRAHVCAHHKRGKLKSKTAFKAPRVTVERRVQVVGSWLWFHFVITGGGEGENRQTEGGIREGAKAFFLSLGGVVALFRRP